MSGRYIVLCGGVGGSKLADGLARLLPPEQLTIVVNTGDDFDHLGLRICPDIDTVVYMLGGLVDLERGWGRSEESWRCMDVMEQLGGETWFRLGDQDLAVHLFRTQQLRAGRSLAEVTRSVASGFGIRHHVVPMSEAPLRTMVDTDEGELSFQDYFVRRRCEPVARRIRFEADGGDIAPPSEEFSKALRSPDLAGIFIAPSNPLLSIAPILALEGVRETISTAGLPVVAVSPLIGGEAVKGPAAKLMRELGHRADSFGIAEAYAPLLSGLVLDKRDTADVARRISISMTNTFMRDAIDRERLATHCLEFMTRMATGGAGTGRASETTR